MYPKIEGLDLSAMDFTAELPYIQVLLRRCVTTWARAGRDLGLGWTTAGPPLGPAKKLRLPPARRFSRELRPRG